ncbi:Ank3 [Symbiodinium natans]|uniref:Ank3 protein n=1 Tax=Symbiodinium natans TaxID=878477 RepID=A0A812KLK0_9DINO|nr:Ank3 [Symbiodinium natans]
MLRVWMASGKLLAEVAAEEVGDVGGLKNRLRELYGYPACAQQILHAGAYLDDAASLSTVLEVQMVVLPVWTTAGKHKFASELVDHTVRDGHVEVLRSLLQARADKDSKNAFGDTALICASRQGHVEIARSLLEAGTNMDLQNFDGETALLCASGKGHIEVVRLLLAEGASKDLTNGEGTTALTRAAGKGHFGVVRLLLEALPWLGNICMFKCT